MATYLILFVHGTFVLFPYNFLKYEIHALIPIAACVLKYAAFAAVADAARFGYGSLGMG